MEDQKDSLTPNRRQILRWTAAAGTLGTVTATASADADDYEHISEIRPFSTRVHDDVELGGHVYLPEGEEPPYGTVLYWSPYWNSPLYDDSDSPDSSWGGLHRLVEEGFAIAAINMRGTGLSEGCLQWGSPVVIRDGYDLVEALADELWSNGKIGMYGLSYTAWSQLLAMAGNPPSLEAVLPVEGVTDAWKFFTQNGAPGFYSSYLAYPPLWDAMVSLHRGDHIDCSNRLRHYTQPADWAQSGDKNGWFQRRDIFDLVADSPVPMFYIHGQLAADHNEAGGHILQIDGLWEARQPNPTRMYLGDWGHNFQVREGFMEEVVQWFDHHLRDGPDLVPTGVVEYQLNPGTREGPRDPSDPVPGSSPPEIRGSWHTTDRWPPEATHRTLYLSGESLVTSRERVYESEQTFQSEDTDPGLGPDQCGPRQAVYASDPLQEKVRLAGYASVTATLTSTLSGGNYVVKLFHTPGDGTCPDTEATELTRLFANLRHWKTPGRARPFPVGEPTEVSFDSQPFAHEVPQGNRIVLVIAGGSEAIQSRPRKPLLTVTTGEDVAGNVELPVVESWETGEMPPR